MRKSNGRTKSAAAMTTVELPSDCRVAWLEGIREQLVTSLKMATVKLDAASVEKIDTAGVQLLAAFQRDAREGGCEVTWVSPSSVLRDAVQRLGLTNVLALPAVTPA